MQLQTVLASCLVVAGCASNVEAHRGLGAHSIASPAETRAAPVAYRGDATVIAESRYGHGTVAGPVRQGARGQLEVRLPGGTWIGCARSCSDTLRQETVDFWEVHSGGRNAPVDGPGYLRWSW